MRAAQFGWKRSFAAMHRDDGVAPKPAIHIDITAGPPGGELSRGAYPLSIWFYYLSSGQSAAILQCSYQFT